MAHTPVNGAAAARTMLGFKTWHRGRCLQAVWTAYSRNGAQDLTGEREPTAYDAWAHTDLEDRRTGTPYDLIPRGVPVYFGKKPSSTAGDIVICDGDGWCIATDIPGHPGVIGRIRLADRQRQIQRPYLGWSTTILDYPIAYGPAPAGAVKPSPTVPEEDDMLMLKITAGKKTHRAALGPGIFKHFAKAEPYEKIMRVSRARDDWQTIDISELPAFLRTYGCDEHIWDFRNSAGRSVRIDDPDQQFAVLDPLTGKVAGGNTWTADGAVRAALKAS